MNKNNDNTMHPPMSCLKAGRLFLTGEKKYNNNKNDTIYRVCE